ncbi:Uncharacterized protein Adt_12365 [Abeliophyllum distichum]|uniref:Uncharacterized protein n=1 Tax=Abeliophyllum distichum TaxID=126358 RepID=A0ABD1UQK1_9LAMI
MQTNFRIINESNQSLIFERSSLQKKITTLEKEIVNLKMIYPRGTTEPKKSVASPVQTVAGKDLSNLFMALDFYGFGLAKSSTDPGTVDFPTDQIQQNKPAQTEIWDTLREPSDKGKEIMQDSQDPEDDIISINRLLSQIKKLQDSPEKGKKFQKQKKKFVKKKNEDVSEKFEQVNNKTLSRVFARKDESREKEIKECPQNSEDTSQENKDEFGEDEQAGTNNSDSGMSFSPIAEHNLDT